MTLTCATCGKPFEAKRSAARFCGDTCRQRAHRAPRNPRAAAAPSDPRSEPDLVRVTRVALESAGVVATVDGQQALLLAKRMASPSETGAAVASMSKQLQAVMAEALKSKQAADPLDELRQRRDTKRAG